MKSYRLILILILVLAFILRFWQLGINPPSLDWDEASIGYNAFSLLKTGKDEYGDFLPIAIRSFNDYKPPLYTYLTIIPVALFGLTEFSTRFISAFFGSLSIIVGYFLIKELFPNKSYIYYLLFTIFFALSPWHLQFSRVAFEANLAVFFFITGILFFLKGAKTNKFIPLSFISFAFAMYAYHSARLVVPLLIIGLIVIYRKTLREKLLWWIASIFILIIFLIPLIQQMRISTSARFSSVSVINPDERLGESIKSIEYDQKRQDLVGKFMHNRRLVYAREILGGYLDHFNFDFLFLTGDPPGRHHAVGMGMLYLWDFPFIIIGVLYLLKNRDKNVNLLFWWFLVAPLASSVTTGTPHAVRALLYIPTYQIFTALGVARILYHLRYYQSSPSRSRFATPGRWLNRLLPGVISALFIFNFYYYLHMYWWHTPIEYSKWWQYGYKDAVEEVAKIENRYDEVIVTYRYDQPYIYFLFYQKIDPVWYQNNWGDGEIKRAQRLFGRYEFRNLNWESDGKLTGVVLVGTGEEIPADTEGIVKEVHFLDGTVAFRIVTR